MFFKLLFIFYIVKTTTFHHTTNISTTPIQTSKTTMTDYVLSLFTTTPVVNVNFEQPKSTQVIAEPKKTTETIKVISQTDDTFNYVMKNYASDLFNNLESIHRNAYEQAYIDGVYEDIWSEFSDIFEGKPTWSTEQHPYAPNKKMEVWSMKLPNFEHYINEYLESEYPAASYDTLSYQGGYIGVLNSLDECRTVHGPDYADWEKTRKNINEMFLDWWEY